MMNRNKSLVAPGSHRGGLDCTWAAFLASSLVLLSILFFATVSHAAPSLVGISSSNETSSTSSNRRTFYDTLNSLHWAFYYNGTAIEYSVSADTTTWNSIGTLPYATSKFSLTHKVINGTSYVFLVSEANSHDIVLRRGILATNSVSFDSEVTVLNGESSSDEYLKPSVALDGNNYVWVSAINNFSNSQIAHLRAVAIRSANAASSDLSVFGSATVVGGPSNSLQDVVILPQAGAEMYLLSNAESGNVVGYKFDGSLWSAANTGTDLSWFRFPQGLNNEVHAIAVSGSDVYVGGWFFNAGGIPAADQIARWDGTSWHALGDGLNNQVYTIVVSGTDIYAGGVFTNAGGHADADYIARWDGSSWHPLGSGLNGRVNAIAVSGGDLFAGGTFTDAGGDVNADRIARWDGSTWSALGTGLNGTAETIAVSGGDLYVGGSFTEAGGNTNCVRICRWDGSSWNALDTGLSSNVFDIAVLGTDVYVGGSFINAGGIAAADYIARWDGSAWNAVGFGLNHIVYDIVVSGGDIYAAGYFTNAGGNADADRIARWDGSTWHALGAGMQYGPLYAIGLVGSEVYVGGRFQSAGANNNAHYLARFAGSSWNAVGLGSLNGNAADTTVYAITVSGSDVYVGGDFSNAGGDANADNIARWDGSNWNSLGSGLNAAVYAIAVSGSDVFVGGQFTTAGGNPNANRIARWDGSSWHPLGAGVNNFVLAIAVSGSDLYVGGGFTAAGGDSNANRVARWDGSAWSALGSGLGNTVRALGISDGGDLYAGGNFLNAGGDLNADRIARWDGSTWNALGTGLNSTVYSIAVSGTDVYAGGLFSDAGGDPNGDSIARWDGTSWNALGPGMIGVTYSIQVSGSDVYAAGSFGSIGGNSNAAGIARWDGSNWNALGAGLDSLRAVAVSGTDVYAGGAIMGYLARYGMVVAADVENSAQISATNDAAGNIHLLYSTTPAGLYYKQFANSSSAWQTEVTLSTDAISDASISINPCQLSLSAVWSAADSILYKTADVPYLAADWDPAAITLYNTGTNASVSAQAPYAPGGALVTWRNGSGIPYNIYAEQMLLNSSSALPFQAGVPGPLTPNIPNTVFANEITFPESADYADLCTIVNPTSGADPSVLAQHTPAYLYSAPDSFGLSPNPASARTISWTFEVNSPTPGACVHFRRFGSEDGRLELIRNGTDVVLNTVTNGNGEQIPLSYEADTLGALQAGNYELRVAYEGGGSDNGFYIDLMAMYDTNNCGAIATSQYSILEYNGMTRFQRLKFAELGVVDQYNDDPSVYNDEFLTTPHYEPSFAYKVGSNSENAEKNSPPIPGVISTAPVAGENATSELILEYTSPQEFPDGAVFVLNWYGESSSRARIYHNGLAIATASLNSGPSQVQTNVLIPNLQAGTHKLRIVAESGTVVLNAMHLIDQRTDLDGDGLTDKEELVLGTDTNKSDSDGDGVDDWSEIAMGSNPLDALSLPLIQGRDFRTGVNSNLDMINIQEIRNDGETTEPVQVTLFDMYGKILDDILLNINSKGQFDVLVHGFANFATNSIGSLSVKHAAPLGQIQTQMVYYRPSQGDASRDYDFAFANSSFALSGEQHVPVNTFYPNFSSINPLGETYNWLELTHVPSPGTATAEEYTGTVSLYSSTGELVRSLSITLEAGGRLDIGAHEIFAKDQVGFASWRPDSQQESFTFKNSRYYFNGSTGSFLSAFQLGAQQGSVQTLVLPIETDNTTTVLELGSVAEGVNQLEVKLYTHLGQLVDEQQLSLNQYETRHIITNEYPLLVQQGLGMAVVKSTKPLLATSMQYNLNTQKQIYGVSGVPGVERIAKINGTDWQLNASYNSYLGQGCSLVVMNANASAIAPIATIYSLSGEEIHEQTLGINANGALKWNPCQHVPEDTYGNVELSMPRNPQLAPFTAWLYREGNKYRFPTPAR